MESFLNRVSTSVLGYDIVIFNPNKTITILPIGRTILPFVMTFICLFVYHASDFLFFRFSHTFRCLPKKEKMFWNLAVIRGLYGFFGTIGSVYARYFDEEIYAHVTETKNWVSYMLVLSHLGFFIFECTAQVYFDIRFKTFSKALLGHHLIAIIGFLTTTVEDAGHYFAISGFIDEMSTPFSCICYVLMKSKLSHTLAWKVNQLVLIHAFHMRSVLEIQLIYEFIKYTEEFRKMSVLYYTNLMIGLFVITFFLTPYWTYRKTEQLFTRMDWNDPNHPSSHHKHHKKDHHHVEDKHDKQHHDNGDVTSSKKSS